MSSTLNPLRLAWGIVFGREANSSRSRFPHKHMLCFLSQNDFTFQFTNLSQERLLAFPEPHITWKDFLIIF